jgi:hypothetical protein
MVFEGGNNETFAAAQFLVQTALEEWLGELIDVEEVEVNIEETTLSILIHYTIRGTEEQQITRFSS